LQPPQGERESNETGGCADGSPCAERLAESEEASPSRLISAKIG